MRRIWISTLLVGAVWIAGPAAAGDRCVTLAQKQAVLEASPFTLADIADTALTLVPGTLLEAKLEVKCRKDEPPAFFFEVEILDELGFERELRFDPETGDLVPEHAPVPLPDPPAVTLAEAIAVAEAEFPGASVFKAELEIEDLGVIYEVKLVTLEGLIAKVEVDPATGEVLESRVKEPRRERERRGRDRHRDHDDEDDEEDEEDDD